MPQKLQLIASQKIKNCNLEYPFKSFFMKYYSTRIMVTAIIFLAHCTFSNSQNRFGAILSPKGDVYYTLNLDGFSISVDSYGELLGYTGIGNEKISYDHKSRISLLGDKKISWDYHDRIDSIG